MKKEQKERVKELNSLIKRKVSKVENKIENLQSTLKDPLAHTQPVVQYVPQPVVAPVEPAKKAPKKRRRQSLRRFEVETSPFKIAEAPRQTRPALVIDKIEPILNIAREEEPVERPSKPIQVIKKTPEPEPEETKPKIKKRKRRHSASGMNNESPKKVEAKQKPEPQPVVKVERSTVKPKTPIKIPEEKPKTPIKIPEEKPKKRTPIKIPEEKPKQQTTHESAKPLLKYQTQAPAPIDVPRASTARQIDFDEYNESENSTDEVIRISKPSLVARTDYQVTQQPVKVSRVSASHSRPFGLVDSETSQTMGTSPMASPTPTGKRSQFQVISGVNVSKANRSASERPSTSMDSNALVTADEITSEEPATPVQVSINIARYSPAPCMYSLASISSDTGSPRSPRGLTRSTIVVPEDELIVSESLSG